MNLMINYNKNEPYIFISYAHYNEADGERNALVEKDVARLAERGIDNIYIDREILPGDNWLVEAMDAIDNPMCKGVLFYACKKSIASEPVLAELEYAKNECEKPVIPIILFELNGKNLGTRMSELIRENYQGIQKQEKHDLMKKIRDCALPTDNLVWLKYNDDGTHITDLIKSIKKHFGIESSAPAITPAPEITPPVRETTVTPVIPIKPATSKPAAVTHQPIRPSPSKPALKPIAPPRPVFLTAPPKGMPRIRLRLTEIRLLRKQIFCKDFAGTLVIGRDANRTNLTFKSDNLLSGVHCAISYEQSGLVLCDLGSTNKTFVNGVPISERYVLEKDDILSVGSMEIRVNWEII